MRTQKLVDGKYEIYQDGIFVSRKVTDGAYKGIDIDVDYVEISVDGSSMTIPVDELRLHHGVHKAVINKIGPWVERELNGKI